LIALDTNVIVRLVTADDPTQLAAAREIFQSGELWICKTVLLETEWVLRFSYELDRDTIGEILHRLLGHPPLRMEDRDSVIRALVLYEHGMDFADALHLVSSGEAERFATFDGPLARAARGREGVPVVVRLGKEPT